MVNQKNNQTDKQVEWDAKLIKIGTHSVAVIIPKGFIKHRLIDVTRPLKIRLANIREDETVSKQITDNAEIVTFDLFGDNPYISSILTFGMT